MGAADIIQSWQDSFLYAWLIFFVQCFSRKRNDGLVLHWILFLISSRCGVISQSCSYRTGSLHPSSQGSFYTSSSVQEKLQTLVQQNGLEAFYTSQKVFELSQKVSSINFARLASRWNLPPKVRKVYLLRSCQNHRNLRYWDECSWDNAACQSRPLGALNFTEDITPFLHQLWKTLVHSTELVVDSRYCFHHTFIPF